MTEPGQDQSFNRWIFMAVVAFGRHELPLRVASFPRGSAHWHVDWFGPVSYPDRDRLYTRPSILVQLSRVELQDGRNPSKQQKPQIVNVHVTVGTLMVLGLGDVWSNGYLVHRNQQERITFERVPVFAKTVRVIKAGTSLDTGDFLLPAKQHPWHMLHTHSYCVEVALADGTFLVIPCAVLLKFYLGSSSNLLSLPFRPDIKRTDLGLRCSELRDGCVLLHLAQGIPARSAEDIARILMSRPAWQAFDLVRRSCLEASVRKAPVYFKSTFPFQGQTSLVVQGVWVSREGRRQRTYVVHEIHSCTAPFPFEMLRYRLPIGMGSVNPHDNRFGPTTKNAQQAAAASEQLLQSARAPQAPELQERDASPNLSPAVAILQVRRKFTDLDRKQVYRWKTAPLLKPAAVKAKNPNESFALTDQAGAARARGLTLIESRRNSYVHPLPDFLSPYIKELAQLSHLATEVITVDEEDGWTVPMPNSQPASRKLKRACVIAVEGRHLFATIVIPAANPTSPLVYADVVVKNETELVELLTRVPDDLKRQLALGRQTVPSLDLQNSSKEATRTPIMTAALNRIFV